MKKLIGLILGLATAVPATAHDPHDREVPHYQKATELPDRIIATLNSDATSGFSVTWRTDRSVHRPIAELVKASPDARFDLGAITYGASTEQVDPTVQQTAEGPVAVHRNAGLPVVHYHSVNFRKLEPDTLYAYRVRGARGQWSEWFQIRTAPADGPLSFVYFGDAQNAIRSHWSRVIRAASIAAPDASFYLHAGDLVQRGYNDDNWAEWFDAGDFLHAMKPSIPVVGNHEYIKMDAEASFENTEVVLGNLWRPQFTLPEEKTLPADLQETVYDVRVNKDLHVFVLNSATQKLVVQAKWLDNELSKSDARWKIVAMHHPLYSTGGGPEDGPGKKRRRKALMPVLQEHKVDMVIVGHHHAYTRYTTGEGVARAAVGDAHDIETMFVISSSGAKMGNHKDGSFEKPARDLGENISLVRIAENTPMFQVIRLDGDTLTFEARMATGELYDAFSMMKKQNGHKRLTNGEAARNETRLFKNTGEYRNWNDLR